MQAKKQNTNEKVIKSLVRSKKKKKAGGLDNTEASKTINYTSPTLFSPPHRLEL